MALWPDNVSAIDGARCPWVFAPQQILQAVCRLTERDLTPKTKVVRSGDKAVHITAMADIQETTWTGETLSTKLAYPKEMQGVVLFANLTRPGEVILEGAPVNPRLDIESGHDAGWRYDSQNAWLTVRIPKEGQSNLQVQGAQYRAVERLPGIRRSLDFEFEKETEGWSPLHDVEDLVPVDGKLKGRITGPDPYVGRSLLQIENPDSAKGIDPHEGDRWRTGSVLLGDSE